MYFSFQHEINDKLWGAIKNNYEKENYTGTIMDAIFCISEMIRERIDTDLDGISLIGKAFGGDNPLLKVNSLRTETEKNHQKGIESILRGIFQAIRNPRAHEKIVDDKKTCDSLITFFNYLVNQIEKAKSKFEFGDFCSRVFDPDFVESEEYADLVINEIPEGKVFECLISLFNEREKADPSKFYYVINSLTKRITPEQYQDFMFIVSEVLKTSNEEHDFRVITKIFKNDKWCEIELAARLRAENKLLKSFEKGYYNSRKNKCGDGALGTWAINILDNLHLRNQFDYLLSKKLSSDDYEEVEYVFRYFRNSISTYDKEPSQSLINAINKGLKRGDKRFYELASFEIEIMGTKWADKIKQAYENFEEVDLTPYYPEDDIPF